MSPGAENAIENAKWLYNLFQMPWWMFLGLLWLFIATACWAGAYWGTLAIRDAVDRIERRLEGANATNEPETGS